MSDEATKIIMDGVAEDINKSGILEATVFGHTTQSFGFAAFLRMRIRITDQKKFHAKFRDYWVEPLQSDPLTLKIDMKHKVLGSFDLRKPGEIERLVAEIFMRHEKRMWRRITSCKALIHKISDHLGVIHAKDQRPWY